MRRRRILESRRALVRQFRLQGLSIREIARRTGVSRTSVHAICADLEDALEDRRPIGRCPTCGRLVKLPCLACRVEQAPRQRKELWKTVFLRKAEELMDLVKELSELREAIRDAIEDGRITPLEVFKIFRELVDVFQIVLPIILGKVCAALNEKKE